MKFNAYFDQVNGHVIFKKNDLWYVSIHKEAYCIQLPAKIENLQTAINITQQIIGFTKWLKTTV
jgi:hypothetical protein